MYRLRIALAQVNHVVGDLEGNTEKIRAFIRKARKADADIVVFPELAVTGYPPDDLLLNRRFVEDSMACVHSLIKATRGIAAVIGCIHATGKDINNAVAIIANSRLIGIYGKSSIKEKSYFDEPRYFTGGDGVPGLRIGTVDASVCFPDELALPDKGHDSGLLICPGALPFRVGSGPEKALAGKAKKNSAVIVYANMAGGQDELVFNGESLIMDKKGRVLARGLAFEEDLLVADVDLESDMVPAGNNRHERIAIPVNRNRPCSDIKTRKGKRLQPVEGVYRALVTGTRDYAGKNGFSKVVLGLSGGMDSALVAVIAADAVGSENVTGVFMPTRYTSAESSEDAYALGENLGIGIINVPIDGLFDEYLREMRLFFSGEPVGITVENIQPRIRGSILMAFANNFDWLVLTTGNKSESATGYSTLYGDTAGGYSVIGDVFKTMVYNLAEWRNRQQKFLLIPLRIFEKEPSAELRHNHKDTDTLPPYDVLDPVLEGYIGEKKTAGQLVAEGFDPSVVRMVIGMVDRNEYKRRQCPIGVSISDSSFWRGRIFPVTNRYRHGY